MKKYILGIAVVIVLGVLGFMVYLYVKQNIQKEIPTATPSDTQSSQNPTPTSIPAYIIKNETDNELIRQALVQKNNWVDDNTILVSSYSNDGKYFSGAVGSTTGTGGGGYVYAIKVDDKWEIVADGNGVILCSSLTKYPDFPKTLIPECYDDKTQKTVKR